MKIYTKIVFDCDFNIIEENYYEYDGVVHECKGGAKAPKPTAQEEKLMQKQADLTDEQVKQLQRQNQLMDQMWPVISQLEGQRVDLASKGMRIESRGMDLENIAMSFQEELMPLQQELAKKGIDLQTLKMDAMSDQIKRSSAIEPALQDAISDRFLSALSGKEPISPAMEGQLRQERTDLENQLSQRLGPDWQTTTAGIQAMGDFDKRANLLREESRQGMITTAGNQYFNFMGRQGAGLGAAPVTGGMSAPSFRGGSAIQSAPSILGAGTSFGETIGGLSNLTGSLSQDRWNRWQAAQGRKAGQGAAMMGGLLGGAQVGASVGGAPGALIGGGGGLLAGYLLS